MFAISSRGECVRLRETDLCSLTNRRGHCERRGYECLDGYCEEIYDDDRRTSSSSTSPRCVYDTDCRSDEICDERRSECRIRCSERNPDGFCPGRNEVCNRRGFCELDRVDHLEHEHRDCRDQRY